MPTNFSTSISGTQTSFDDLFMNFDPFRKGNLWVWGANSAGQIGHNSFTFPKREPTTTFAGAANWKQVACGYQHTAAIKTDGTLWIWGGGTHGALGDNTSGINRSTPVTTFAGGTNWKQVSCGYHHTAAIKTDGTLWIWGLNAYGQLGNNTTTNRTTPVTTFAGGTNWKQVACGSNYTAAIKTDGTLWNWGRNTFCALGTNDTTQRDTPVTTFAGGTNWKQVDIAAAIKTDGTLWTWGGNTGDNTTTIRSTPVTTFAGGTNWKQVASGYHTAAIKTDGTLWLWGPQSFYGGLGNNSTISRSTPITTTAGGTNWKQVSVSQHTAAIKTDGTLWTWGKGAFGQMGNGFSSDSRVPIRVFFTDQNICKQVACGGNHTATTTYIDDYQ